jgi:uncharacterized protein
MVDTMWSLWMSAAAGGALIGLASGGLMLFNGRIAGVSGIFHQAVAGSRETWRWAFIVGLLLAGGLALVLLPTNLPQASTNTNTLMLVIGGLLVGYGTRMASGCTSGHGVCGLARFSGRSLVAVLTFLGVGIVVTYLLGVFVLGAR